MRKLIIGLLAPLLLVTASCETVGAAVGGAPAPLAKTTFDDSALSTAWKSFGAVQDLINLVLDVKPALIGTPGAKRVADANDAVSAALTAAENAAAAGSTTNYVKALNDAKAALANLRVAIAALRGVQQ